MKISKEIVNELRKKIDITYEEAVYMLQKYKGNIDKCVEKHYKKKYSKKRRMGREINSLIEDMLQYKFTVTQKGKVVLHIPLLVLLILFLFIYYPLWWVLFFVAGLIILSGSEVRVHKVDKDNIDVKEKNNHKKNESKNKNVINEDVEDKKEEDGFTEIKIDGSGKND